MTHENLDLLGEQIAADVAHLSAATHRVLVMLRTFDAGAGWQRQGFRSCAQWLAWRVGWTPTTAREHVRVANSLAALPRIEEAMRLGQLSYSKVRAITRVATPANENALLEQALLTTGHQLDQICRKYAAVRAETSGADHDLRPVDVLDRRYVRRRALPDGTVVIEARLSADESVIVWAALERVATEHCRARPATAAGAPADSASRADRDPNDDGAKGRDDAHPTSHASAEAARPSAAQPAGAHHADAHPDNAQHDAEHHTSTLHVRTPGAEFRDQPHPSNGRASAEAQPTAFDRASALVAMSSAVLRGDQPRRSPTELMISVPVEALHAHMDGEDVSNVACCRDGTALSPAVVRRLACDAGLVAVVEDARGTPLGVGRKLRTIAGAIKRALLRRDQTCRFPGCTSHVFLEGHHIQHWADGGKTELSNIVGLCSFHHRFVHEYGFQIALNDDGTVTAYAPDGSVVPEVPARMQLAHVGWPTITARNTQLGITSETLSTWDGTPADYVELIDVLVRADATTCTAAA